MKSDVEFPEICMQWVYGNNELDVIRNIIVLTKSGTGPTTKVTVTDPDVANFIVLSRPIFIKLNMSKLYTIDYRDTGLNSVNSYDTTSSLVLKLSITEVTDPGIFSTNLASFADTYQLFRDSGSVNCGSTQETEVIQEATKFNLVLYYLSSPLNKSVGSQGAANALTNTITLYTRSKDGTIFSFNENIIKKEKDSIVIQGFGTANATTTVPGASTSILLGWFSNRVCVIVFNGHQKQINQILIKLLNCNGLSITVSEFNIV